MKRKDRITYYSDQQNAYIKIGWFSPQKVSDHKDATNFLLLSLLSGIAVKVIIRLANSKYKTKFRKRIIANLSGTIEAGIGILQK